MKKTIAALLAALLLLGTLAGCGGKPAETPKTAETPAPAQAATPAPTNAPAPAPAEETPAPTEAPAAPGHGTPEGPCSPEGSVLLQKDGLKVTAAGLGQDPTSEDAQPIVWLDIENAGEDDVCLGVTAGSVNGFMSTVVLISFFEEDGSYTGGSYDFALTLPAGAGGRYALGYYKQAGPGVALDTLSELEFRFTTAQEEYGLPDYTSAPIVIVTGEEAPPVDIASLGTVVADDERMLLVVGEQDYDDWFGPLVYIYCENRTDKYLSVYGEKAEADGIGCDYVYYGDYLSPGKRSVGWMAFEGGIRELKGFENLSVTLSVAEAETMDEFVSAKGETLAPVTVTYPPQVWGEYEADGLRLEVQPRYNDLITVETFENDPNGILFTVSETASLEAGGYEGAGWLFSIARIDGDRLHELLCWDMSGANVFAKDEEGGYYLLCHPTDVRYERATAEEMQRDADRWSMLCDWVWQAQESFRDQNGLDYVSFDNSEVVMYVARAAWQEDADFTLSSTAFGPVDAKGVDGTPYAEFVLQGFFWEVDPAETPDGEYVVLYFPEEDVRLDFFYAPGAYVRMVSGETERLYQAVWYDDFISYAEAMEGWYHAAAEQQGVKPADGSLEPFCGDWHEQNAGRGTVRISRSVAPGKVKIEAWWPESAAVMNSWELIAVLEEDGRLVYEYGHMTVTEFDENGEGWTTDERYEESGWFALNDAGELLWHDDSAGGSEDSVFVR